MEPTKIWQDAQERVINLCLEHPEAADTVVPATPEWTVRDLVAHMTGVDADIIADAFPDDPNDEWTASHLAQREGKSLSQIVDEWRGLSDPMAAFLDDDMPASEKGAVIGDVSAHEQDLRGALNTPGARDHEGMKLSLASFLNMFSEKIEQAGAPALHIKSDMVDTTIGKGDAQNTLEVDSFELHRALTGRRSESQIRAFGWTGSPEPYIDLFSFNGCLRDKDLVE